MKQEVRAKLQLFTAMFIFGTIGIFVRYIPLPSSVIALGRGSIGTIFLLLYTKFRGIPLDKEAIKRNAKTLFLSGLFIGLNWIFLFEAYRYTTVSTATLFYYLAPTFVLIASPILLKETLSKRNTLSIIVALIGMVFVSGVLRTGFSGVQDWRGIMFGILAALFYAGVMLSNQWFKDISVYERTIMQLLVASLCLLPYTLLTEDFATLDYTSLGLVLLVVVGIIHTGVAYAAYFGSMTVLNAQTVAIYSYVDPIIAIILSALLLNEPFGWMEVTGAVLILGSTIVNEYLGYKDA